MQVPHLRTLNSLCRVSRLLNKLATPKLYETTTIQCCPDLESEHSPFEHFSKIWPQIEFGTSIRYIQNLKIKDKRCDCCSSCWHDLRGHSQYDEENVTAVWTT